MIAYLDCFAGASGDMILAALLDAGADVEFIANQISRISDGIEISTEETRRHGIRALQLVIRIEEAPKTRTLAEVTKLIEAAGLDPEIADPAVETFRRLAEAESRIHGSSPADAHFHELEAADTIVDAVGVAAAIRILGIERIYASPVATGSGMISAQHGALPLPAPAALELLKGAPVHSRGVSAELVTPTGAALLAQWATFGDMPEMVVHSIGYGAGSRDLKEIPNLMRVILGEPAEATPTPVDQVVVNANIDDMNPELYEHLMDRLFAAGADDVWIVPAIGKRGRPAQVLSVLSPLASQPAIREVLFTESSTIGLRTIRVQKWALPREWLEVRVAGEKIRVKVARFGDRLVNAAPEFQDCAEAARRSGRPLKEIYALAQSEALRQLNKGPGSD
jgi:uncharacterized protein (TIGR00299 family) protein